MNIKGRKAPLPDQPFAHLAFEANAALRPNAIAVTHQESEISYHQLNIYANRLAHYLKERGIGKGSVVGLCVDRTPALVWSLLAILKSGACYIAMDPTYPPDRLVAMLSQVHEAAAVLVSESTRGLFADAGDAAVLCIDTDLVAELAASPSDNPQIDIDNRDDCYVVFTSGSTGTPKGVAVTHEGWYNLINWLTVEHGLDDSSSNLVMSSLAFDMTQCAIMAPLFCGATAHLLPSRNYDPALALRIIRERDIRTLQCTPSTLYPLLDRDADHADRPLLNLDYILVGGEHLVVDRVAQWVGDAPTVPRVVNVYGPAECTHLSSSYEIENLASYGTDPVPAGAPVYNTTIHILDEDLREVPQGSTGEICISGISLGRYLNPESKDAGKFTRIENDGKLIDAYRTGDQGFIDESGQLIVIGRYDAQVKIRGIRIELGDVETAIRRSGPVTDCVVVAVCEPSGDQQLAAFIIPSDQKFDMQTLRTNLLRYLPRTMIPSKFIEVTSFPVTINGKLNRKALITAAASTGS